MRHLTIPALLICMFCILPGRAQRTYDLQHFQGMESEGPVPADIQNSLRELYAMDKERVREYNKGRMTNRDRVLYGSYQINKMMASGRVLYGDPITQMVEKVADKLLEDEPALRSQLRFYTVKSSSVNAFCTGQGMIFVNVGLIAQLQDESQLAYVLAHEIVHYVRKHNLEILTRNTRKDAKKGTGDDEIWESDKTVRLLLKYHHRSHAMETEADTIGLTRFYLKAGYATDLDGIFDVLQYSALPFDEVPFDTNYFNTERYKVPHNCFLDTVKAISARDDYDDSKSSHPNIKKRRTLVQELLKSFPAGGSRYVVTTEAEFDRLRTLARFECIHMDLIDAEYANAFYSCYLLQKTMPDNLFLEKARLQALYGLSKYKSFQSVNSVIPAYSDYEGEIQQIYYLFQKISAKELSAITVKELWKANKRYTDDKELALLLEDIGKDLFAQHHYTPDFFIHPGDTVQAIDTVQKHKNLKYERIRKKKQEELVTSSLNYVFYELFEGYPDFDDFLQKCHAEKSEPMAYTTSGASNGIYLYSPTYRIFRESDMEMKIQKSEAHESQLPQLMEKVVGEMGFSSHDFSDQALQQSSNAQSYNEFAHLNEWTLEFLNTKGNVPMRLYTQPWMNQLNEQYDAGLMNLVFVGNLENMHKDHLLFGTITGLFSIFGTAPTIYNRFANREETYIASLLVDTRTGKLKRTSFTDVNLKDNSSLVKSVLYQQLNDGLFETKKDEHTTVGYLGKRAILSMGVGTAIDYMHFMNEVRPLFPLQLNLGAEYVLPDNQSVAIDISTRKTFTDYDYFYQGSDYSYWGLSVGTASFNTRINRLRAAYCLYGQNAPAPIGPYMRIGLTLTHFSMDTTGGFTHLGVRNLHPNHLCFGISGSLGRNYIFFDRLVFKMAVHYGITFASPFEPYAFSTDNSEHLDYKSKEINHIHNARTWLNNLLGWELGIGLLL